MDSHAKWWALIDDVAKRHGLSTSALAKRAGLDPTAFNPSKRVLKDGRKRWPSTESVTRALEVVGEELDFAAMMGPDDLVYNQVGREATAPMVGFAEAGTGGYYEESGFPTGQGWDDVPLPSAARDGLFALTVSGDSMMPLYRDGDKLLVSRVATIRTGDRVVAKTLSGEVMAKQVARDLGTEVILRSLHPDHPDRLVAKSDIEWMGRIMWVSQ